ncbi:MAG: hypothetical protein VCA38_18955 [Roseibacillus sp.]|jgi:hypothetical protein
MPGYETDHGEEAGDKIHRPAGGAGRQDSDQQRLRHARERHEGFDVGMYIQTPPLLFTRDGHNLHLGDRFRGRSAFLIGGGPSFANLDHAMLSRPGCLSMAMNNAVKLHRPDLWISVDNPSHFVKSVWLDPKIEKFVPMCHSEKKIFDNEAWEESDLKVGDCPNVVFYRRNEHFQATQYLFEDTVNWGNHKQWGGGRTVMLAAIRILFFMGVRRIYLLGVDLMMSQDSKYHFEQDRTGSSITGNNRTYALLANWFEQLKPHFAEHGLEIYNCNAESSLKAFPFVEFEEAVGYCTRGMPEDPKLERTEGLYDRKARAKQEARKRNNPKPPKPATRMGVTLLPPVIVPVEVTGKVEEHISGGDVKVVVPVTQSSEWMLEWWYTQFSCRNSLPILFADAGMGPDKRKWCESRGEVFEIASEDRHPRRITPAALVGCGVDKVLIVSPCCEVRDSLSALSCHIESRLLLARDSHLTGRYKRYFDGGAFFNAAVVGGMPSSEQAEQWLKVSRDEGLDFSGVQDSLNYALYSNSSEVLELPQRFNRLRLDGDRDDPAIMNWTGKQGAAVIREQMEGMEIKG